MSAERDATAAGADAPPRDAGLTASEPYVSAHGRAQAVVFLFLAYVAVALFSIVSDLLQISFLSDAAAGAITEEGAEMNDARQMAVALIHVAVYVALAVAFLLWLHRASRNLPALGNAKSRIEYTPRWAVGSFFIPLAHFFMPYKAVREVWKKSDPAVQTGDDFRYTPTGSSPLLLGWWLSWVALIILGRIASRLGRHAETIDTMLWLTWLDIAVDGIGVVAAVLAIFVVRDIDRRQDERARHVTHAPHTPPQPPLFTPPDRAEPEAAAHQTASPE